VQGYNNDVVNFCTYYAGAKPEELDYLFVLVHGAGHTALSFALLTRALLQAMPRGGGCFAFDLPAHGLTTGRDEAELSRAALLADCAALLDAALPQRVSSTGAPPHLVLIGHSLGGVLATYLASQLDTACPPVAGLVVMDVVVRIASAARSSHSETELS
jgi:protein phosphatase methylesterase 1